MSLPDGSSPIELPPSARLVFTSGSPLGHPYHTDRTSGVRTMAMSRVLGGLRIQPRCWMKPSLAEARKVSSAESGEAMAMPTVSVHNQGTHTQDGDAVTVI